MGSRKIRSEAHRIQKSKYSLKLWLLVAGPKSATERLKTCREKSRGKTHKPAREKKEKDENGRMEA